MCLGLAQPLHLLRCVLPMSFKNKPVAWATHPRKNCMGTKLGALAWLTYKQKKLHKCKHANLTLSVLKISLVHATHTTHILALVLSRTASQALILPCRDAVLHQGDVQIPDVFSCKMHKKLC